MPIPEVDLDLNIKVPWTLDVEKRDGSRVPLNEYLPKGND